MKVLVGFFRIFVGIFFIISGFIKLNDPLGFSYKLTDYFAPDVLNLEFLNPYALVLSIFIVIFEVMVGVLLIIGYKVKFTLWSLLGMIIFFTFLTFYSAYFDKVKDCGCFGDALKITPWQSFGKDVVLTLLILLIFVGRKHLTPFFSKFANTVITFVAFILCMWYAYHVLMHLPEVDFRAYKEGVNINEGMSVPEGAPKAVFAYNWEFEENGTKKIVTTQGAYPQTSGKFIGVTTEVVQEGYIPPIHDFSIEKGDQDFTDQFLNEDKLVTIISYNLSKSEADGMEKLADVYKQATQAGYKVIGISASGDDKIAKMKSTYGLTFDFYFCDETALKTIVRSNPGIVVLNKGTIKQKLHWNDAEQIELP